MAIIGANGAGKSTLAYVVCGIIPHLVAADLEGTVRVLDRRLRDSTCVREFSRDTSILFQNPEWQFLGFTAAEELALSLKQRTGSRTSRLSRAVTYLEQHGLGHLAYRDVRTLSMGEMQKVAVLSATISRPSVLVLDEPSSALDEAGIRLILDVLADCPQTAAMILGHDGHLARTLTDRVLGLQQGRALLDANWDGVTHEDLSALREDSSRPILLSGVQQLVDMLSMQRREPIVVDRLVVDNVSYRYPRSDRLALRPTTLEARSGSIVCLEGPNGSGKTTLLMAMAGILRPREGSIQLCADGRRVTGGSKRCPRRSLMLQNPATQLLTDSIEAELHQSLALVLRDRKRRSEAMKLALEAFSFSGENVSPDCLSFGWQKLLTLACCVCLNTDILLLDEPELGLDEAHRHQVGALLRYLAHSLGRVVVFSGHDRSFIESVADEVVTLGRNGQ